MKPLILTELIMATGKKKPQSPIAPSSPALPQAKADSVCVRLGVRVVPGAAQTAVVGMLGDAIKIRLAAVPEDGAANKALCKWLQAQLGAQAAQVQAGTTSRSKIVAVYFSPTNHPSTPDVASVLQRLLALSK